MIKLKSSGEFKKTRKFLRKLKEKDYIHILERYGILGVNALAANTPIDTGKTASSWAYKVVKTERGYEIVWTNSNKNEGVPIAILIQYGHGTGAGTYVEGIDYINPALKPIFNEMSKNIWREVVL